MNRTTELAAKLKELGYEGLFLHSADRARQIWDDAEVRSGLRALIRSDQYDMAARFLAAELYFRNEPGFPGEEDEKALAGVYGAALGRDIAGIGNVWGLPGETKGPVSKHVVRLGERAVPALREQLSNERELMFEGSEEATLADMFQVRVKDVAAWLICEIRARPYEGAPEPDNRDAWIAALENEL